MIAGSLIAAVGCAIWTLDGERRAIGLGLGVAWMTSSMSTATMILAKERSPGAFWWAWGCGMTLRMAALIGLAAYGVGRPDLSLPCLLVSYALGVLLFLQLEYRHVKLK